MNSPPAAAVRPAAFSAAPKASLPIRFFVPGVAALLLAAGLLPALASDLSGWYYQRRILALVHTITLGFALPVFLGASIQFLPVVFGKPIARTRRLAVSHVLYFVGAAGMIAHFWIGRWPGLVLSASALVAGVTLFFTAALPLLRGAPRDNIRLAFALAFAGLALTMAAGLAIGLDRAVSYLPGGPMHHLAAHIHLGLLATFAVAIFGVEAKILPMFLLAPPPNARRQGAALALMGGGAILLALFLWQGWPAGPAALVPAAAVALQIANLREIFRRRSRKEVDPGFRYAAAAYGYLAAAALLGLAWAFGIGNGRAIAVRLPQVYVYLLLVGFIVQTIVGILSKILPFLVWQSAFSRHLGARAVPTLKEMSSERLQRIGFWLFQVSVPALGAALALGEPRAIRATGALFCAALVPFLVHVVRVLSHLKPLAVPVRQEESFARAR